MIITLLITAKMSEPNIPGSVSTTARDWHKMIEGGFNLRHPLTTDMTVPTVTGVDNLEIHRLDELGANPGATAVPALSSLLRMSGSVEDLIGPQFLRMGRSVGSLLLTMAGAVGRVVNSTLLSVRQVVGGIVGSALRGVFIRQNYTPGFASPQFPVRTNN